MGKYVYAAIVRPDVDDGGFWAEVPDLPGCFGQGEDYIGAIESVSDGIETHLVALAESGKPIPKATVISADDAMWFMFTLKPMASSLAYRRFPPPRRPGGSVSRRAAYPSSSPKAGSLPSDRLRALRSPSTASRRMLPAIAHRAVPRSPLRWRRSRTPLRPKSPRRPA